MTDPTSQTPAPATVDAQVEDLGKSVLASKTLWVSVIAPMAITVFPPLAPLIAANPTTTAWVAGLLMAGLRLITTSGLKFPWSK